MAQDTMDATSVVDGKNLLKLLFSSFTLTLAKLRIKIPQYCTIIKE